MLESSDRPFQCNISAVITFLNREQEGAREIHRRLRAMYWENPLWTIHKTVTTSRKNNEAANKKGLKGKHNEFF